MEKTFHHVLDVTLEASPFKELLQHLEPANPNWNGRQVNGGPPKSLPYTDHRANCNPGCHSVTHDSEHYGMPSYPVAAAMMHPPSLALVVQQPDES